MTLIKVKKNQLKRLFIENDGTEIREIIIIPCKMRPDFAWVPKQGYQVTKTKGELYLANEWEDTPLDDFLNAFTVANCNNEVGTYPAFYVKGPGYKQ